MSAPLTFELGNAVSVSYDQNGFLGVQYDAYGDGTTGMPPIWLHHAYGRISRPLDRTDDGACGLLYSQEGTEGHAWLAYDRRVYPKIPAVNRGGQALYDSNGSFINFDPETRTVTHYVPYADGKAHLVTIGNDTNGKPFLELASGTGLSVRLLDDVLTLTNADGSSYVTLDSSGTTVFGPFKAASGADIGGPTSESLAKFAALQAVLVQITSALTAINGACSAPPLSPIGVALAPILTALNALMVSLPVTGATVSTKGA